MSIFARAEDPPRFMPKAVERVSFILAAIFILLAVSQLFTYENFPHVLGGYRLLGNQIASHLGAALIVTSEVFTLPFLLRLRVSPLMRMTSFICLWFVTTAWAILSISVLLTPSVSFNSGLLGDTFSLQAGYWQAIFSIILLALVGYMTWSQCSTLHFRQSN